MKINKKKKKIFIKFLSNDGKLRKKKKKRNFHHYKCEGGTCFEHNLKVYTQIYMAIKCNEFSVYGNIVRGII